MRLRLLPREWESVVSRITGPQLCMLSTKVILATTPASAPDAIGVTQINAFVQQYGAANGIRSSITRTHCAIAFTRPTSLATAMPRSL
jgi:hypothetical protein